MLGWLKKKRRKTMIKFEETEVQGFKPAIRGMRNPMNSWRKSDSIFIPYSLCDDDKELDLADNCGGRAPIIGSNDKNLMMQLAKAGTTHSKYRRMISVYVDITAPLYWWKEFDTYKVGTVANSCSTMHKIHDKEFTIDDFSTEHLLCPGNDPYVFIRDDDAGEDWTPYEIFSNYIIEMLNACREAYLKAKDNKYGGSDAKKYWWQMIQLLPSSYNQKRTVMLNYEVLANIYHTRKDHKLDEWRDFCKWIEKLPYSDVITC